MDYDPPRDFPFWLNVEPTNVCQLDCVFCSRQLSKRPLGYLDLTLACQIAHEAASHEGAAIRFTGWGEPLLHPQIGELVTLVKERGVKLKIYTNGLLLTSELMDTFIEAGLDDLQFSLQGLTPYQYEWNRKGASYKLLERNILMAREMRGAKSKPFLSILTSTLANELEDGDPEEFTEKWLKVVDKVAIDLTNLNFVKDTAKAAPFLELQSKGLTRGKCVDVFLALEVKYDGSIQFCGQDSEGKAIHTIGKFGDLSLREAWQSPKMEAQRELVGRNLFHEKSPVCINCYHNTDKYDLLKKAVTSNKRALSEASMQDG
ncbi:MAG: radical SAM protein [Deltaproteobacteria bacterium]|nr:radical SAM protein [Deltaproteobacteria bacterium]